MGLSYGMELARQAHLAIKKAMENFTLDTARDALVQALPALENQLVRTLPSDCLSLFLFVFFLFLFLFAYYDLPFASLLVSSSSSLFVLSCQSVTTRLCNDYCLHSLLGQGLERLVADQAKKIGEQAARIAELERILRGPQPPTPTGTPQKPTLHQLQQMQQLQQLQQMQQLHMQQLNGGGFSTL